MALALAGCVDATVHCTPFQVSIAHAAVSPPTAPAPPFSHGPARPASLARPAHARAELSARYIRAPRALRRTTFWRVLGARVQYYGMGYAVCIGIKTPLRFKTPFESQPPVKFSVPYEL